MRLEIALSRDKRINVNSKAIFSSVISGRQRVYQPSHRRAKQLLFSMDLCWPAHRVGSGEAAWRE